MREWNGFDQITGARGMYLVDKNGRRLLDGVASMWCNVWGHSRQELVNAIQKQAAVLQHSPMFNLTNGPAEKLAKSLVGIAPGMDRVFFSDNGSTAMEIAFKIALQFWANRGEKKIKIAALENGYHGDTFGAMSVGYVPEFFQRFKSHLFPALRFPVPNRYRPPRGINAEDQMAACIERIEKRLAADDNIAAFVMESGAQMAGGAIIYPDGFQQSISKICKRNGVLLILDEIATGFGRLGAMAEYVRQKSRPDIVAYGKMLTGGYLTMSATLVTKKIYDSFSGEFGQMRHLFHGHTYTGNPIAAALANENLRLYKKENLIGKIKRSSDIFGRYCEEMRGLELVGDIRHRGMLMGIELVKDKRTKEPVSAKNSVNKIVFEAGKKHGIYLRTLGNIIMLVPPLAIPDAQLESLIERTVSTVKSVRGRFLG